MGTRRSTKAGSQLFFGILIILIGILFLLDNFEIIAIGNVFRYWPALLIVLGLVKINHAISNTGRMIGLLLAVAGSLLLLGKIYYFHFDVGDWWPLVLIIIGGSILINSSSRHHHRPGEATGSDSAGGTDSVINLFALMGGYKRASMSQDFRGGDINAVMGGCEIDLREASIKSGPAVITLFTFWGGIDIKVPKDWKIINEGIPVLGGIEDKTVPPQEGLVKQLIIKGQAVMAGVTISN